MTKTENHNAYSVFNCTESVINKAVLRREMVKRTRIGVDEGLQLSSQGGHGCLSNLINRNTKVSEGVVGLFYLGYGPCEIVDFVNRVHLHEESIKEILKSHYKYLTPEVIVGMLSRFKLNKNIVKERRKG
jgi:hypothetical protein